MHILVLAQDCAQRYEWQGEKYLNVCALPNCDYSFWPKFSK